MSRHLFVNVRAFVVGALVARVFQLVVGDPSDVLLAHVDTIQRINAHVHLVNRHAQYVIVLHRLEIISKDYTFPPAGLDDINEPGS